MTMNPTAARAIEHAAIRTEREADELRVNISDLEDRLAAARADLAAKEATVAALRNPTEGAQ